MFEDLKLSNDLTIFTSIISNIDNELLAKDLEYNCEITQDTSYGPGNPGLQSSIQTTSTNIQILKNEILKKIVSFFKLKEDYICTYHDWTYISDAQNKTTHYHNHITEGNIIYTYEIPQWTLVYYVQIPNNLNENEGRLFFKTKESEISILPKENQILMFSADVLHKPSLNTHSTNKRIVYGANFSILDRNKKYTKLNKTLL